MSQHNFQTKENRNVLYGLDKPTGGYFFTEFWKDEEIVDDEVKNSQDSLTLTELISYAFLEYGYTFSNSEKSVLVNDWFKDQEPSSMQYQVNSMFGKDLKTMLNKTHNDFVENHLDALMK
jgi:hypothetical protein